MFLRKPSEMSVNHLQYYNHRIGLAHFFMLTLSVPSPANMCSRPTVITDLETSYPKGLYMRTGNQDRPAFSDAASASPSARLQICQDIGRSGVFAVRGMEPVHMDEAAYEQLQHPKHWLLSFLLYGSGRNWRTYYNPYILHAMQIDAFVLNPDSSRTIITVSKKEYLFLCLLAMRNTDESFLWSTDEEEEEEEEAESSHSGEMPTDANINNDEEDDSNEDRDANMTDKGAPAEFVGFYVSKEYNAHRGLHAHRFVLLEKPPAGSRDVKVLLAAASAHAYSRPDFNVELHYIELRKHRLRASSCERDPVCKLIIDDVHLRRPFQLCATVLASSYFADRVQYPDRISPGSPRIPGYIARVSFKTRLGVRQAFGNVYEEFVLPCFAKTRDGVEAVFYISRAYNPNQVFVLANHSDLNDRLYLEALITDVSVVHEPYYFEEVEI